MISPIPFRATRTASNFVSLMRASPVQNLLKRASPAQNLLKAAFKSVFNIGRATADIKKAVQVFPEKSKLLSSIVCNRLIDKNETREIKFFETAELPKKEWFESLHNPVNPEYSEEPDTAEKLQSIREWLGTHRDPISKNSVVAPKMLNSWDNPDAF